MNSTAPLPEAPNASWPRAHQPPGGNGSALSEDCPELVHAATLVTCTFLLTLIFFLGSYGNVIVFLSFFDPAFRKFRTNFDFMVLNLSFCDLFICGVTAPMFTFVLFLRPASALPDAFCFTFHLTSSGFLIMSLKTVAVIALHRLYLALGRPPGRATALPCSLLLVLLLWASSFTLAALATPRASKSHLCLPMSSLMAGDGTVILSLYVVDFAFCVAVVSVSYIMIAQTLCDHRALSPGVLSSAGGGLGAGGSVATGELPPLPGRIVRVHPHLPQVRTEPFYIFAEQRRAAEACALVSAVHQPGFLLLQAEDPAPGRGQREPQEYTDKNEALTYIL